MVERIAHINRMMIQAKKILKQEVDILNMNILDAINNLIAKRRTEFELLWIKYQKICKTIENLQHKENFRLNQLEGE